jgi:sugar/nucleoside kinase (ribokinase family)
MKKYDVYALGNALVDIEYHVEPETLKSLGIDKGVMTLIDEHRQLQLQEFLGERHEKMACGGSAANTQIALAQLGGDAYFSCRVADDIAGAFYVDDLKANGVDSHADEQMDPAGHTGKCLVFVTPDADRTMNTFLGVSAHFADEQISELVIAESEWVYLEGYLVTAGNSLQALLKARDAARAQGAKTALTLSDPFVLRAFREGMLQVIGDGVDLLFANEEEACELAGCDDFERALEVLRQYSRSFAVTRGAAGAVVFDGERQTRIDGFPVKAIDTLGAGDMFAGSFLYGITHGMDYEDAGRLAAWTSSRLVTRFGPRLEAEGMQQLLRRFKAGNFTDDAEE